MGFSDLKNHEHPGPVLTDYEVKTIAESQAFLPLLHRAALFFEDHLE